MVRPWENGRVETVPEVRFARRDGVSLAYSRWGYGSHVVVYTPPLASNVELVWEAEEWARACRYGGEHHQLVMIDKRGVGLSDRVADPPTLEDGVLDTLAVLDAEGIDRVDLVGQSEGGSVAIAIAAQHPERVRSLVLIGAPASGADPRDLAVLADADNPFPSPEQLAELFRNLARHWGSPQSINLEMFAPSVANDMRIRRWYQRYERQCATTGAVLGILRSLPQRDLRPLLTRVRAPTLVMHAARDRIVHVAHGRYLGTAIHDARYIEYDMDDHLWMFSPQWRQMLDDGIEFITGARPAAQRTTAFATVLFTDIVESTQQEAALGNARWNTLLDRHDRLAASTIASVGGRVVKQTGDGLLALFPDPAAAVQASLALTQDLGGIGLSIRAGLHSGMVELRSTGDVTGIAVNIAARVQVTAQPGEVLVSDTIRDLMLGSNYQFDDRGVHELKGIDGHRRLFSVTTAVT
jgi:class 3 adenylate cyclase/pimeloyl-ACP methyl ester carboxylesterase